jgi:AcrR family transcriptional regulator
MPRRKVVRGEGETRRRILDAAVLRFASASYEEVSLRDIAVDVGVDVAYVHRSFGSKEGLFREVMETLDERFVFSDVEAKDLSAHLAKMFVESDPATKNAKEVDPLLIHVRSLTSPNASPLVSERLQSKFIVPISTKLGDSGQFRAAAIMGVLIGLGILRNLAQLPAMTEANAEEVEALLIEVIEAIGRFNGVSDRGKA